MFLLLPRAMGLGKYRSSRLEAPYKKDVQKKNCKALSKIPAMASYFHGGSMSGCANSAKREVYRRCFAMTFGKFLRVAVSRSSPP